MKELELTMKISAQDFLDVVHKINEIVVFLNKKFPETNKGAKKCKEKAHLD